MPQTIQHLFDLTQTCILRDDSNSKVVRYLDPSTQSCFYQKDFNYRLKETDSTRQQAEKQHKEVLRRYWVEREMMFILVAKDSPYMVRTSLLYDNKGSKAESVITRDAGLSINDWLHIIPQQNTVSPAIRHPFQYVSEFLKLAKACLEALYDIHQRHIIHIDIKSDNICLPYTPYPFNGNGVLQIDYSNIAIIDFTYAVHKFNLLQYALPINKHSSSGYQSESLISALQQQQNWQEKSEHPCQALDYSADLYSLGYMLEEISLIYGGFVFPQNYAYIDDAKTDIKDIINYLKSFNSGIPENEISDLRSEQCPHLKAIEKINILAQSLGQDDDVPFMFKIDMTQEFNTKNQILSTRTQHQEKEMNKPTKTPVSNTPISEAEAEVKTKAEDEPFEMAFKASLVLMVLMILGILYNADAIKEYFAEQSAAGLSPSELLNVPSDSPKWQQLQQQLAANTTAAQTLANDLTQALQAKLNDDTQSEPEQLKAHQQLRLLAQWNVLPAKGALTAFETHYTTLRQEVFATDWWETGQGETPLNLEQFVRHNIILSAANDRGALLNGAKMRSLGRGVTKDVAQARKMYEQVLQLSPNKQDDYVKAAKEGLFYLKLYQYR